MKTRSPMSVKRIKAFIARGYHISVYGKEGGFISEIDFTHRSPRSLSGFSYMAYDNPQKRLKALYRNCKKVLPKLKAKL